MAAVGSRTVRKSIALGVETRAQKAVRLALEEKRAREAEEDALLKNSDKAFDRLRWRSLSLVRHSWFDKSTAALILLNCISLASVDPLQSPLSDRNFVLTMTEKVFAVVFTIECLLRLLGMGFRRFWASGWCRLDLLTVLASSTVWMPNVESSFTALQALRVLRPLRTISRIKGMRFLVNALVGSLRGVYNVAVMLFFFIFVFAIFGLQLFMGLDAQICVFNESNTVAVSTEVVHGVARGCSLVAGEGRACPQGVMTTGGAVGTQQCRLAESSLSPNARVYNGLAGFDHIGLAMITVFQCITTEGWSRVLVYLVDASDPVLPVVYCVLLIVFMSFFLLSHFIAVVCVAFAKASSSAEVALANTSKSTPSAEKVPTKQSTTCGSWFSKCRRWPGRPTTTAEDDESAKPKERNMWVRGCLWLIEQQLFEFTVTLIILGNTVLMAMDHHGMAAEAVSITDKMNVVFNIIFAVELIIKVSGLGWRKYWSTGFNRLDAAVVLLSTIELLVNLTSPNGAEGGAMSALRVLRLLRIVRAFKLVKSLGTLRKLLDSSFQSVGLITNFIMLLVLFLFISALLGMTFFGGALQRDNTSSPRGNFDTFVWSVITTFQILTKEQWESVMYDLVTFTKTWVSAIYPLIVLLVGNYVLLSLFLGTLINKFADFFLGKKDEKAGAATNNSKSARRLSAVLSKVSIAAAVGGQQNQRQAASSTSFGSAVLKVFWIFRRAITKASAFRADYSFWLLGPKNLIRGLAARVSRSKWFEYLVIAFIVGSSITLSLENPLDESDPSKTRLLFYIDLVMTSFFVLEGTLRALADGFILNQAGSKAYLRDGWNFLDFSVVVVSVWTLALTSPEGGSAGGGSRGLRVIRTLRVLRPLKAMKRWTAMRNVADSLVKAIVPIINVFIIWMFSVSVFAIVGVNLLKGQFFFCNEPGATSKTGCSGLGIFTSKTINNVQYLQPRTWSRPDRHFDSFPAAMLTLLEMSTLENWPGVMHSAVDAVGVDQQPVRDNAPGIFIYFLLFIIVNSFFCLNMFVSVVVSAYSTDSVRATTSKIEPVGDSEMFDEHAKGRKAALIAKPRKAKGVELLLATKAQGRIDWIRQSLARLVGHRVFVNFITVVIILNVLALSMSFRGESKSWADGLKLANTIFLYVFIVEAGLKLLALWGSYWTDQWNLFDFALVGVGIFDEFLGGINTTALRIFRVFRVLRVARIANRAKGVRSLLNTFLRSLDSLIPIGGLLFLLFFIFGVMGVNLFAVVRDNRIMVGNMNFKSFGSAVLTLLRITTGEKWGTLMFACAIDEPICTGESAWDYPGKTDCGPGAVGSYIFFITFEVFCTLTVLNLFIAVILANFFEEHASDTILMASHVETFVEEWCALDPLANGWVEESTVRKMLRGIPPPLGAPPPGDTTETVAREEWFQRVDDKIRSESALQTPSENLDGVRAQSVSFWFVLSTLVEECTGNGVDFYDDTRCKICTMPTRGGKCERQCTLRKELKQWEKLPWVAQAAGEFSPGAKRSLSSSLAIIRACATLDEPVPS